MMQSETLPSELNLSAPPTLPQARSYLFKQKSELQEYDVSQGNKIRINLPRLQRSYLMKDSYLRFRVNIDFTPQLVTNKLWLDRCGAFGLFNRIEVYDYLGGTLLEQTQNIPALVTLLGDLDNGLMDYNGRLQTTQGYQGSNIQASATEFDAYEVRSANTGYTLFPGSNDISSKFLSVEFCIPMLSFLGIFSDKYVPLHNGFSIDFFLNDPNLAFVSRIDQTDTINQSIRLDEVWISNFEYCCQVMELGEQAESMVLLADPFVIPAKQFRYFSDTILGNGLQSSFRLDMNLNVVSLRNIRWGMRPAVYQALAYPSYGHRIRNFVNNWNFQYGSSYLPEIAGIDTRALTLPTSRRGNVNYAIGSQGQDWYKAAGYNQSYIEFSKTTTPGKEIAINMTEYMIDLAAQYGTTDYAGALTSTGAIIPVSSQNSKSICGKFAAGLDTRLSQKATISGIDTNGLMLTLNAKFDENFVAQMAQAIVDVWAEHDAFIQVIPGIASTVTF
jgi:hypothetical protein